MRIALELLNIAVAVLLINLAWVTATIGGFTVLYVPAQVVFGAAAFVLLASSMIHLRDLVRSSKAGAAAAG